jgi:glycosyltransferase involved in cell wall biosynthesis
LITRRLGKIRQQIGRLHVPLAAYGAVGITEKEYIIAILNHDGSSLVSRKANQKNQAEEILSWIRQHAKRHNLKIIAMAIINGREAEKLAARLWLEEDIVPYIEENHTGITEAVVRQTAARVVGKFDENHLVKVPVEPQTNEVTVAPLVTVQDYETTMSTSAWRCLQNLAQDFKTKRKSWLFINATPQGGGVALMRHALMRLFKLLEVEAHWHVLQPDREVFEITKTKFHNILQKVASPELVLTETDQKLYSNWIDENVTRLTPAIKRAGIVVIDDPQPSGLIPKLREINPAVRIIYRSHIHLDSDLLAASGTPQEKSWQFIWKSAQAADLFVSHPIEKFVPQEVQRKTVYMPATTDPLDGLNKELDDRQLKYYMSLFNKILLEHDQQPLDEKRPYIIQVARFDPSKGIPDVIEAYRQLCEKLGAHRKKPQLVLVGHGSIDDPDGIPIYNMTMHLLQNQKYASLSGDIKVVRLHHNDQIFNALLRASYIALQLSHKEGFEVKVTEALHKGKPVIAYRTGGIPLQIEDGETGYLVETHDIKMVADKLYELLVNEQQYEKLSRQAQEKLTPHYLTGYNALKWLYLAQDSDGFFKSVINDRELQIIDQDCYPGQPER